METPEQYYNRWLNFLSEAYCSNNVFEFHETNHLNFIYKTNKTNQQKSIANACAEHISLRVEVLLPSHKISQYCRYIFPLTDNVSVT